MGRSVRKSDASWWRVASDVADERRWHTSTIEDARTFVPRPKSLLLFSVLKGQVPMIAKPDRIAASRNVSQPVLAVPASPFVSDCLKA